MDSIKHLRCLSAVKSMGTVNQLTPTAFPGNHCPMHTALSLGARIKGVSTLVIGTAECGYYSRNIPLSSPYATHGLHWTYLLDSKEVVFGFRNGLIDAIKEMDKAGANVILLLATCVPELIGEDIESICFEIQPEVSAMLIHIPLGNFKCGSYQPGYWKTLLALGKVIEKADTKTRVVNIMGRSATEDHIPMPEIVAFLECHDVPLRFLAPDSSLEEFVLAGAALLNISLSPFMNPLAEWMAKEHDVPFISLHDVYSIREIKNTYSQIEKHLGLEINKYFIAMQKKAKNVQKNAAVRLSNIQYISANIGALQPLPLSSYLSELGMSPIMIHMEEFYPSDTQWKERLIGQDKNPIICLMLNEQADMPLIKALCPDMVFGDWGGRSLIHPKTVHLLDLYGQAGYERTIEILERITSVLDGNGGID